MKQKSGNFAWLEF